jgi:hypothetical protein
MSIEQNSNAAQATNRLGQQVEYGRVADVERLFGIGKSTVYSLLKSRRIRGCSLTVKGKRSRLRLVDLASVRSYIETEVNQQQKEKVV